MNVTRTTRVRGLAPWRPQQKTEATLKQVQEVLEEYHLHLPLTVRQIFYRLVGSYGYEKNEKAYKALGEILNRARRADRVPFDAIRDDGIGQAEPQFWDDAAHLARSCIGAAEQFKLDRQTGQPARLVFICEASGMLPQLERVASPFGIPAYSCGGFDSTTAKYDLAVKLGRLPHVEVLHIGDHDPSGTHMFTSLAEDVQAIASGIGLHGDIKFTRLAVTPAQVAELGLPTAPPKETDRRAFSGETTQAEAIPPDVLAEIIQQAIADRHDRSAYARVLEREREARKAILGRLKPLLSDFGGAAP